MTKLRQIEVDEETAVVLEARAQAGGITVSEVVADLLSTQVLGDVWPEWLERMRAEGKGPWSPEEEAKTAAAWAEYQRTGEGVPWEEAKAWMESWFTENELPPPKPRRL